MLIIINKALCRVRASSLQLHMSLSECLQERIFFPYKIEPYIWLQSAEDHYEHIAICVDDLLIASKESQHIVDTLVKKYEFKLKGKGPISYHTDCDFSRDEGETLHFTPRMRIEKMIDCHVNMFRSKPKTNVVFPLKKGKHPELDTSPCLGLDGIQKYQSLIGAIQLAISLGRLDTNTPVMALASFKAESHKGHLERDKRVLSCLARFDYTSIRIRTEEPDLSSIPATSHEWEESVCDAIQESILQDAPESKGKYVAIISYCGANSYHNVITRRSVTGIIHFINKTPINWHSKK